MRHRYIARLVPFLLFVSGACRAPRSGRESPVSLSIHDADDAFAITISDCFRSLSRYGAFDRLSIVEMRARTRNSEADSAAGTSLQVNVQRIHRQLEGVEKLNDDATNRGGLYIETLQIGEGTSLTLVLERTALDALDLTFEELSSRQFGQVLAFFTELDRRCASNAVAWEAQPHTTE